MAFFEKNKDKIWSKYTLKRTKLHRFKNFSRGSMPPNPPSNAHGFAMRSMSLRDMQIPKSEKKKLLPPPLPNPGDALVCIIDKVLRKWRNMVSLDVYIDIIICL